MLRWYPSVLLRVVLWLTFVPVAFVTVLAIRCVVRGDTQWQIGPWGGPGTSGDFWLLALWLVAGWEALVLGWRGAGRAFKVVALVWHFSLAAVVVMLIADEGAAVLRGDDIDLRLSLAVLGPTFVGVMLGLLVWWVVGDVRRGAAGRSVGPLRRRHLALAGVGAGGVVAAGIAFRADWVEFACVVAALAQVALLESFRPTNPSEALRSAFEMEGSAPR